jgi:protein-tyrosine phosphatase
VLFVCTGNLCRSPYAAAFFASRAAQAGLAVQARSAGLCAAPGVPSPPGLIEIGKEEGLDLSGHVAACVGRALVEEADLILVMERSHLQEIHHLFPGEKEKMLLLSEFASERNRGRDIADPYGLSPAHYRASCEEIRECVEGLIHFLRRSP